MTLRPLISLSVANALIRRWHSHHKPVKGHKFSLGAEDAGEFVGALVVGRPVAAALNDGFTFEVTRLCTNDRARGRLPNGHARGTASFLLGAAWRSAKAMGVRRLVSYVRFDEDATCYRAAGWSEVDDVEGRGWTSGNKSDRWLPGLYAPTTEIVDRVRWEVAA